MSKKNRWISRELGHLDDHMKMLEIDLKAGNDASGLTNWGLAMGIINKMIEKDKDKRKVMSRLGKGITFTIKLAVDQAVKSAIEGLKKDGKI